MHIITVCPRCGNDFMHGNHDTYLDRTISVIDEVGNNEIVDITICQDCDHAEQFCQGILEYWEVETYQEYMEMVKDRWLNAELNELEQEGLIVVNLEKCEYKEDGSYKTCAMRPLTEKEFNARFK